MLTQRILTAPDFNFRAVVESHGWRQLAPFSDAEGVLAWVHRLKDGRLIWLQVRADANTSRQSFLRVESAGPVFPTDHAEIDAVVRHVLCMDWDLSAFYAYLRAHPAYAWVQAQQAGRMLRSPTLWEDLVKTLLTTNTTWQQTINMVARLVTLGEATAYGHAFPTPAQVAALDAQSLAAHLRAGYRGAYLHALAVQISNGDLNPEAWLLPHTPAEALYRQIRALKGFGDYAAASVMRLLGQHGHISLDSVAREAFNHRHHNGQKAPDALIKAHYAQHGPWQGLVMWMDVLAYDAQPNTGDMGYNQENWP